MTEVITLRVSRETKKLMKEMDVNWSEDIRNYIEARIKSFRLNQILPHIYKTADRIKVKSDSTILIREDRDSR